jgi:hypothetical protein
MSHLIWLFRTRQIRKEAKFDDKTFDDVVVEYERQGRPFQFAERRSLCSRKNHRRDEETRRSDDDKPPMPHPVPPGMEDDRRAWGQRG